MAELEPFEFSVVEICVRAVAQYSKMNVMKISDLFKCTSETVFQECSDRYLERNTHLNLNQISQKNANVFKIQQ